MTAYDTTCNACGGRMGVLEIEGRQHCLCKSGCGYERVNGEVIDRGDPLHLDSKRE